MKRRKLYNDDSSSIVLRCDEPVVIQCDASDSGLGAALLQTGIPVAYSSRALTSAETKVRTNRERAASDGFRL